VDQGLPCLAANLLSASPPALSRRKEKEVRNRTCVLAKPSQAAEATQIRSGSRVESGVSVFKVLRAERDTQAKINTPVHASTCAGAGLKRLFFACGEVLTLEGELGAEHQGHMSLPGASVDKTWIKNATSRHNNEKSRMCP